MNNLNVFSFKSTYFFYGILLICIGYATFEYFFIPYAALSADEFVFARHIYEYTFNIPYRDFPPYKTILGYYLLSIPMFFSHALLEPLFYIKKELALINLFCIILASYWASLFFDKKAILLVVLTILVSKTFLINASDLRVDMLTSWMCLFAALSVLQRRVCLGGILLSIAFLISQKALWYFFAINGGMVFCWLLFASPIYSLRSLFLFNSAVTLPIILYAIGWSVIASPAVVFHNLFYEAYIQAGINWFFPIYLICWRIVLYHGPLLFLLWPLTFVSLFEKIADNIKAQQRVFIISFTSMTLLLFIHYKQPFPYNFVFTIPAFFLLYAEFISWLIEKNHAPSNTNTSVPSFSTIIFIAFYMYIIIALISIFSLPTLNYLIVICPPAICVLYYFGKHPRINMFAISSMLVIFAITGIIYPLYTSLLTSSQLNGDYQKTMIKLASNLIDNESDYVGAIPFLYQKDQPIEGLKNLIGPALEYLYAPTDKLETLLLPSLYLAPTKVEKVLNDFEKIPVKFFINNFRIVSLPPVIQHYLNHNYQHFYGSIYLYAPTIKPSALSFILKFTAAYRVEISNKKTRVMIDGKKMHAGKMIHLKKGDHVTHATGVYRLVLVPKLDNVQLDPRFQKDEWPKTIQTILS